MPYVLTTYILKKLDMQLRGELIAGVKPDIIVSIHMNSYPDPSVKGAQAFYYPDSESGEQLATMVQNRLREFLDPTNKRVAKGESFPVKDLCQSKRIGGVRVYDMS